LAIVEREYVKDQGRFTPTFWRAQRALVKAFEDLMGHRAPEEELMKSKTATALARP
jgi:hypothetical protein